MNVQNITQGMESHRAFAAPPGANPRDGCGHPSTVACGSNHNRPFKQPSSSTAGVNEVLDFIARGRSRNHGRRPSFLPPSRKPRPTSDLPVRNSQFMKSKHDAMQCDDKCFVSKSEGVSLPLIGSSRDAPWASFSSIHSDCKSMCRCFTQSSSLGDSPCGHRVAVQLQG